MTLLRRKETSETIINRRERLASALLRPINPAAVVFLGVYTFIWGWWVGNPLWTVFTQAGLYEVMASIAPEWFWGGLAIIVGSVTIYGAWKRSYKALTTGASVAGWHWAMIAFFYFAGDPLNTGGITALTFAVYSAFVYLNLRVNFKYDKNVDEIFNRTS